MCCVTLRCLCSFQNAVTGTYLGEQKEIYLKRELHCSTAGMCASIVCVFITNML